MYVCYAYTYIYIYSLIYLYIIILQQYILLKTHILLPRLFAKIGTNMTYIWYYIILYIYILSNSTFHFKTHICSPPQTMLHKLWQAWHIYVCFTIYLYLLICSLSSNNPCTCQGWLPQLTSSSLVVSLGGVIPCRKSGLGGKVAPANVCCSHWLFQAWGGSGWWVPCRQSCFRWDRWHLPRWAAPPTVPPT